MSHTIHRAIVVTSRDQYTQRAHAEAIRCCGVEHITPLGSRVLNGVQSFLVTPGGSKDGWPDDVALQERQANFVSWLNRQRFDDGSTPYNWVRIEYGEILGEDGARIVDHTWIVKTGENYNGPHELEL